MKKQYWMAAVAALFLTAATPGSSQAQPFGGPDQPDMTVDAATRTQVIDGAIRELNARYVFPDLAKKMEKAVRDKAKRKEYDPITSAKALAQKLTADLQEVSKDRHLRVGYSHQPLPDFQAPPSAERQAEQRRFGSYTNQGFDRVERLDGNIGYLKFRGFFDPATAGAKAEAAMAFLSDTDALIIDLRENGGGSPEMVAVMCSYLFDDQQHLNDIYSREDDTTQQYWTLPYVPGPRYAGRDVYVLTSSYTFSGAEEFTYNLKNLKRATIVGETTGGGAHPTQGRRINDHFMIGVPFARAINPITKTNWEGTGVAADVSVPKEQALHTAHIAAVKKQLEKEQDPRRKSLYQETLNKLQGELEALKKAPADQKSASNK